MSADSIKQYTVSVGADINSQQFERVSKALSNLNAQFDRIAKTAAPCGAQVTAFVKPFQDLSASAKDAQGGFRAFADGLNSVNKTVDGVKKEVKKATTNVQTFFAAMLLLPAIAKGVKGAFNFMFGWIGKGFKKLKDFTVNSVKLTIRSITGLIVAPFKLIGNLVKGSIETTKNLFRGAFQSIQNGFRGMSEGGRRHLRELGHAFTEWGRIGDRAYRQFTGFLKQTARQDLEMQKLSNRFMTSKQSMMQYQYALEALGASIDDISLSPELSEQFEQLRKDGSMLSESAGYDDSMRFMRAVAFQFIRLQHIGRYAMQTVAASIIKHIFGPLGDSKSLLEKINEIILKYIPAGADIVGRAFGNVMNVIRNVADFIMQIPKFVMGLYQSLPDWAQKAIGGAGLIGLLVFGASNPLAAIGAVIAGAMLLINSFVKWQKGEGDLLAPIWDLLEKKYKDTVNNLNNWITQIKDKFVGYITDTLWPKIQKVWTDITGLTSSGVKEMGNSIQGIVKNVEIAVSSVTEMVQKALFITRMMRSEREGGMGFLGAADMIRTDFDNQFQSWRQNPEKYEQNLMNMNAVGAAEKRLRNRNEDMFDDYFVQYGNPDSIATPALLKGMAYKESTFNTGAKNGNHLGLMQFNPNTFKEVMPNSSKSDIFKADKSIMAAARYLEKIDRTYYAGLGLDSDKSRDGWHYRRALALLGYNTGPSEIAGLIKQAKKRGLNGNKKIYDWVLKQLGDPKASNDYAYGILSLQNGKYGYLNDADNPTREQNLQALAFMRTMEQGVQANGQMIASAENIGLRYNMTANIASSGRGLIPNSIPQTKSDSCGVVAVANMANLINGNNNLNENSFAVGGSLSGYLSSATGYSFVDDKKYDLRDGNKEQVWGQIESSINNGVPVIIGLGGQPFTGNKHYMLIDGIEGNKVHLTDGTGKSGWYSKDQINADRGHSDSGISGSKVIIRMTGASQKKFVASRKAAGSFMGGGSVAMPLNFGMGGIASAMSGFYDGASGMMGGISALAGDMINSGLSFFGGNTSGNGGIYGGLNIGSVNISVQVAKTNAQPEDIAETVATSLANRLNYFMVSRNLGMS